MDHKDIFFTTAKVWVRISKLAVFFQSEFHVSFAEDSWLFRMVQVFDFWAQFLCPLDIRHAEPQGGSKKTMGYLTFRPWDAQKNYDEIDPLTGRSKEILKFRKAYCISLIVFFGHFLKPCSERNW